MSESNKCSVYLCKHNNPSYKARTSYVSHMAREHPEVWKALQQEKRQSGKVKCQYEGCSQTFVSNQKMKEHFLKLHSSVIAPQTSQISVQDSIFDTQRVSKGVEVEIQTDWSFETSTEVTFLTSFGSTIFENSNSNFGGQVVYSSKMKALKSNMSTPALDIGLYCSQKASKPQQAAFSAMIGKFRAKKGQKAYQRTLNLAARPRYMAHTGKNQVRFPTDKSYLRLSRRCAVWTGLIHKPVRLPPVPSVIPPTKLRTKVLQGFKPRTLRNLKLVGPKAIASVEEALKEQVWSMPTAAFVPDSTLREPQFESHSSAVGVYKALQEEEKKVETGSGSDSDEVMSDLEYHTKANLVRVAPFAVIPLSEEQQQMIVSVLSLVKDCRQRLRSVHQAFDSYRGRFLQQLKKRKSRTIGAMFASSVSEITKVNLSGYLQEATFSQFTEKELSVTVGPTPNKLRVMSFEAQFESFCTFGAFLCQQLGQLERLTRLATKHNSVGESLLGAAVQVAASGSGAYCWTDGTTKWKEFLCGSALQLQYCEEQLTLLDAAAGYSIVPMKEVNCASTRRCLGLLQHHLENRGSVVITQQHAEYFQQKLDKLVLVLQCEDGSQKILKIQNNGSLQ